mmetsp:Transcript_14663/g.35366  ORF Transcript_14663/g.35366 Transcript_14663/m.35366 type:complete len:86 (+) Transcript_14663:209-466(+)
MIKSVSFSRRQVQLSNHFFVFVGGYLRVKYDGIFHTRFHDFDMVLKELKRTNKQQTYILSVRVRSGCVTIGVSTAANNYGLMSTL